MKRYLGPLLCALSTAACTTNKPAEAPEESARTEVVAPSTTTSDATPISDTRLAPVGTQTPDSSGTTATQRSTSAPSDAAPATIDYKTMNADVAPDNTGKNKRDTKSTAVTPLDQGEGHTDLDITKKIRQAVVGDHALSFTAKNVKIITQHGKVTLRGPVNTNEERSTIQADAEKVAGAGNVDNQLEVKK